MGITTSRPATWVVALSTLGACSTTTEGSDTAGAAAASFGGSGDGGGAASAGSNSGGSGGGQIIPGGGSGGSSAGAGGSQTVEPCAAVEHESSQAVRPADIILAIDQSGSMDLETAWVTNQLGSFANQITASGVDVHVVVIAGLPGSENGFCIPPPLGSGGCPDDNNLPTLLHIDQHVGSNDAWNQILAAYPHYQPVLRPGAAKHVVVITDDEAAMTAMDFNNAFRALDPQLENYTFHAIYSSKDDPGSFSCFITPEPCCGVAADEGKRYRELVNFTGGVSGDLCQQNFQPVWTAVSAQIVDNAPLECEWVIPDPTDGDNIDPNEVNVKLIIGGQARDMGYVDDPAKCGLVTDGWHYDDPANPTRVILCPDACTEVQGAIDAKINLEFECERREAIPK